MFIDCDWDKGDSLFEHAIVHIYSHYIIYQVCSFEMDDEQYR
mgnify:CR=1 FL=1